MRSAIVGLAALLLATPAAAAEESGWVFGLGSAFAFEDFDDASGIDIDDSSTSGAQFGYRLGPALTIEAELDYLRDFEGSVPGASFDFGGWYAGVSAKLYPFASQLRPYLMLGVGCLEGEVDVTVSGLGSASAEERAFTWQAGAGLDLHLDDHWTLELQGAYRLPRGDLRDLNFYTLGGYLRYRF